MNSRHPLASLIPTTSPDDIASAVWHLRHVVDASLQALVLLEPDVGRWEVPVGALDRTVEMHDGYLRARRRVADLVARVREHLPVGHHPNLEELEDHVRQAMLDASEAGWRLGMLMSRAGGAGT
jgi:hypothetical protein